MAAFSTPPRMMKVCCAEMPSNRVVTIWEVLPYCQMAMCNELVTISVTWVKLVIFGSFHFLKYHTMAHHIQPKNIGKTYYFMFLSIHENGHLH